MRKLIELLNEYGEYDLVEHNGEICKWDTDDSGEVNIYTDYTNNIISKKYGFIKRLVDNNKLDEEELQFLGCDDMWIYYENYEIITMVLSISDKPIDDLINLLN